MTYATAKPFIIAALATATTLSGIGGYALVESHRPAVLELFIFNTPGNPAVLIRTPNDRRILVNGGANSEIVQHITDELPFYSRRIDTVIATDDDPNNVTGLIDVVNRYSVDKVVVPSVSLQSLGLASTTNAMYQTFLAAIDAHKIPAQEIEAGNRLTLDEKVVADILFPTTTFQYSKASAPQILVRINYGATSFTLMADASIKVQKYIAAENSQPSDVLVTSNNGNASNLAVQLIDSLAPDYLVYSQQLTKQGNVVQKPAVSTSTKPKADPLAGILNENRFNIREKGNVKIVSDGSVIKITDQ